MQPYINEVIKFAIRQQRPHIHIRVESAWEKKYLTWEKKHLSKQEQIDAAEKKMNDSESTPLPKLQGWFLKEKHETFKRHQGFLPGQSCNCRWFTIEHASELGNNESSKELLLCYYKLASAEKEQRCGWLFLNDIISLSQDIPNRWITIEHPSRVIRIQSPTPVQHQVWFYFLSKCCKNVQRNLNLPSSTPLPAGLPYFSEIVMQKMRKNSLKYAEDPVKGTPKDELDFLREITGGSKAEVEMVQQNRNLFRGASFSTSVEDVSMMDNFSVDEEEKSHGNDASQKIDFVNLPVGIKNLGTIPSKTHYLSEDNSSNSEASGTSCLSVSHHADLDQIVLISSTTSFMKSTTTFQQTVPKSMEVKHIHGNAASGGVNHDDSFALIHTSNDSSTRLDVLNKNLKTGGCLSNREQGRKSCLKTSSHHCSINNPLSKMSKSSAYQVHFANEDDDKILPDDDFLRSDWDA